MEGTPSIVIYCWFFAGGRVKAKEIVAYRKAGKSKPTSLSSKELSQLSPCEIVKNVLPTPLADKLLEVMVEDVKQWKSGTWWMFGKEYIAPRSSAFFDFRDFGQARLNASYRTINWFETLLYVCQCHVNLSNQCFACHLVIRKK